MYSGVISWDEYHFHFLVEHQLMAPDKAKDHQESEHKDMDDDRWLLSYFYCFLLHFGFTVLIHTLL